MNKQTQQQPHAKQTKKNPQTKKYPFILKREVVITELVDLLDTMV